MCKVLAMAGLKPEVKDRLWDFLIAAKPLMTAHDTDGVGYAAMSKNGLWGERWLEPSQGFMRDSRKPFTTKDAELEKKFKGALLSAKKYNNFGAENADPDTVSAVIYHSRWATCEKSLGNVHPFVRGNTALIHNGVITNTQDHKNLISTCDSEAILNQYVDKDVLTDPDNITKATETLMGGYACAVLSMDSDNKKYLDLFRNRPPLYAIYVEQLDTVVFCTSDDIIKNTCKLLKWSYGSTFKLKDDMLLRFDCETGEIVHKKDYKFDYVYMYDRNKRSSSESASDAGKSQTAEAKTSSTEPGWKATEEANSEKKTFAPLAIVPLVEQKKSDAV